MIYQHNHAATRETTELDKEICLSIACVAGSLSSSTWHGVVSAFSISLSIAVICLEPRRGAGDNDVISGEFGKGSGAGGRSGLRRLGSGSGAEKYKKLGSIVIGSAMGVEGCDAYGSILEVGGVEERMVA